MRCGRGEMLFVVLLGTFSIAACVSDSPGATSPERESTIGVDRGDQIMLPVFPSRERVAELTSGPAEIDSFPADPGVQVVSWILAEPLPLRYGHDDVTGHGRSERALSNFARDNPNYRPSAALLCVARQRARFHDVHGGPPDQALADFMALRCGWPHAGLTFAHITWKGSAPTATVDSILAPFEDPEFRGALGLWISSNDEGSAVEVVAGVEGVEFEPVEVTPAAAVVEIVGRLPEGVEHFAGYVSRGRLDAAGCAELAVEPGRFGFRCELDPDSPEARVEIVESHLGRGELGAPKLSLWLSPDGTRTRRYRRSTWAPLAAAGVGEVSLGDGLVREITRLRAVLGRAPLMHAGEQSKALARLHPHLLAASLSDRGRARELGLAALAGRELPTRVLAGSVSAHFAPAEIAELMAGFMRSPTRRAQLLSDDVDVLAFDVFEHEDGSAHVLVGTWRSLPAAADHGELEDLLVARVNRARVRRGHFDLLPLSEHHEVLGAHAELVGRGELGPSSALRVTLDAVAGDSRRTLSGFHGQTQALEQLVLPGPLLDSTFMEAELHVEVIEDPSSRWAVLFVVGLYFEGLSLEDLATRSPAPSVESLRWATRARSSRQEVTLEYCVDERGHPSRVEVTQGFDGNPAVDRILRDTLSRWRFRALERDGAPAMACARMSYDVDAR